jgi:hypothetical protein
MVEIFGQIVGLLIIGLIPAILLIGILVCLPAAMLLGMIVSSCFPAVRVPAFVPVRRDIQN